MTRARGMMGTALLVSLTANAWMCMREQPGQADEGDAVGTQARRDERAMTARAAARMPPPAFCQAETDVLLARLAIARARIDDRRAPDETFEGSPPNQRGTEAVKAAVEAFLRTNRAGRRTALGQAAAAGAVTPADLLVECRGDSCVVGAAAGADDTRQRQVLELVQSMSSYSPELNRVAKSRRSIGARGLRFRLAGDREVAARRAILEAGRLLREHVRTCEATGSASPGVLHAVVGSGPPLQGPAPRYGTERLWYATSGSLATAPIAACVERLINPDIDRLASDLAGDYPVETAFQLIVRPRS
jgi:hypothetical protein